VTIPRPRSAAGACAIGVEALVLLACGSRAEPLGVVLPDPVDGGGPRI